ncbi:helix-turn-helix transcriptional regulator [Chitinophaga cymbidii]|uniref:HTH araC/xylS-type domain-containing protein n=1 Tax=Chitinophaga cymbidii TaxID=1096750 RepID=A0A512RJ23_9BACT|nr:helix-turn-helix transcriptional regulator [Chitinophaga cymbidii]GEP95711.1 hypothetical protein CCY01nite_19710 [Chitinophaga cymbidii]
MKYLIPGKSFTERTLLPPYDHPYFIQYADTSCLEGTFGSVMIQRVPGKNFSLTQHIFDIRQPVEIQMQATTPMITLAYLLKGNIPGTLGGLGRIDFHESRCHLNYAPPGTHLVHLEPQEYAGLQIHLEPSAIKELADKSHIIREVWSSAVKSLPEGLHQTFCHIGPRMREVLHRIFHCTLEEPLRGFQLHIHVLELVLLYVQEIYPVQKDFQSAYHYTQDDHKALESAFRLQQSHPADIRHHKDLAKLVHLHPRKLLDGFNLKYGINMNSLKIQTRITEACILLLETDMPVKDIAHEVGYTDSSAFIRAFKQNVGQTPLQYRHEKPGR